MITKLDLRPLRDVLMMMDRAQRRYIPGLMSAALIEIPKVALADAVLEAIAVQTEQARAKRLDRLQRLPQSSGGQVGVVDLELRRKRRARTG